MCDLTNCETNEQSVLRLNVNPQILPEPAESRNIQISLRFDKNQFSFAKIAPPDQIRLIHRRQRFRIRARSPCKNSNVSPVNSRRRESEPEGQRGRAMDPSALNAETVSQFPLETHAVCPARSDLSPTVTPAAYFQRFTLARLQSNVKRIFSPAKSSS